jgi:putative heme-binding domain-containing protein
MSSLKPLTLFVLVTLFCRALPADEPTTLSPKDKLIVETILRLKEFDIESSAPAKAAVLRYLKTQPGTDQYFELIGRFKPVEIAESLADFSLEHAAETAGVRGAELLFAMNQEQALQAFIEQADDAKAVAAVSLIGHAGGKQILPMLLPLLTSPQAPLAVKAAAIAALGRRAEGQREILALVKEGQLAEELNFAAANALLSSDDQAIAQEAGKYLQLPATADSKPLPPLAELVARQGDAAAGAEVFRQAGTCIKCHKVRGEGKEVGPDLSEIGSKLSREAMYVSILDPSAAISHNFETYSLLTDEGVSITGLLVSETDDSVTLRTSEGIDKTADKDSIELFKKQKRSLMPQDLQKLLTADQLVDLVEYALTLRRAGAPAANK